MRKWKGLALLGLMVALIFASQISIADAHTPGPMTLEYDTNTDILTVTVTHVTADVNSHYIYEIVIEKNSVQVDIQTYTSQSDASQVVETFSVVAVDGDVLEATAKCSVSGQVTKEITIGTIASSSTSPPTGIGEPMMWPILIGTAIIAIGIVMVVVLVVKRR